jgi:hypothetical protein
MRLILTYNLKIDRDLGVYYEEIVRLLNEIIGMLKENNTMHREHNMVINSIDNRVREFQSILSTCVDYR